MAAEPETRTSSERKRTGQLSGVQVMFAVILAVGLILTINFSTLIAAGQPLQEAFNKVSGELETLKQEQAALINERDYARSDAYVESWARDEGKMVRPGERLIIPKPSQVMVETTPQVIIEIPIETTPPQPEPWMLWWALFFDSVPPGL